MDSIPKLFGLEAIVATARHEESRIVPPRYVGSVFSIIFLNVLDMYIYVFAWELISLDTLPSFCCSSKDGFHSALRAQNILCEQVIYVKLS